MIALNVISQLSGALMTLWNAAAASYKDSDEEPKPGYCSQPCVRLWKKSWIQGRNCWVRKIQTQIGTNLWVVIILAINLPFVCIVFRCFALWLTLFPCRMYWALQRDQWTTSSVLNTGGGYFPAEVQLFPSSLWQGPRGSEETIFFPGSQNNRTFWVSSVNKW